MDETDVIDSAEGHSSARAAPVRPRVRATKVSEGVAAAIVDDIVSSGLRSGDRLPPEIAMAEQFGVGRASIREAMRVLEVYGLIEIRKGQKGGPVVTELDPSRLGGTLSLYFHTRGATIGELIEARCVIEPALTRQAAEKQDAGQLSALREVMHDEQAAVHDYLPCAHMFHYVLSGSTGNRVLDLLGQSLRALYSDRLEGSKVATEEVIIAMRASHAAIGDAVLAGDGTLAERLMREHVLDIARAQAARLPWLMDERIDWTR